jgi:hypothetical protein
MRPTLLLAAALLGTPAAAFAQAAAPQSVSKADYLAGTQRDFVEIDADKNGTVTTAEVNAARDRAVATLAARRAEAMFAELDSDKNGSLNQAEFAKLVKPAGKLPPSPIMGFDTNKDGRITAAEYKAGTEARFARLDANKDGLVTEAEMKRTTPSR